MITRFLLLPLALHACWPPQGQPPGEDLAGAGPPHVDTLPPLPLPEDLPAEAWTRTAPVTIVDERGHPLKLVEWHHTSLSLEHVWADRALVRCTGCCEPVEGWVQTWAVLPRDATGEAAPEEALARSVAGLRRAVAEGRAAIEPPDHGRSREQLLSHLDRGFAMDDEEGRAVSRSCPGDEGTLLLQRQPGGGWAGPRWQPRPGD